MIIMLIFERKWQKNATKYLYLPLPATEDELLSRNNLFGLVWTCASFLTFDRYHLLQFRPQKLHPENLARF